MAIVLIDFIPTFIIAICSRTPDGDILSPPAPMHLFDVLKPPASCAVRGERLRERRRRGSVSDLLLMQSAEEEHVEQDGCTSRTAGSIIRSGGETRKATGVGGSTLASRMRTALTDERLFRHR